MPSSRQVERADARDTRTEARSRELDHDDGDVAVSAQPAMFTGRTSTVQRKVAVGSVSDPLELEADAVAGSVVATLRRQTAGQPSAHQHDTQCGCGDGPVVRRHVDQPAGDSAVIGFEGGELAADTEHRLNASAGRGTPIPDALRTPLEGALGADLSGVRLHAGGEAAALNQGMSALAFTHGRDVYFRDGLPDTTKDSGLHLLAHELTHTVQQGAAPIQRHATHGHSHVHDTDQIEPETFADAIGVRRATVTPRVQRHAAYEHYLLGQLQPTEIASIAMVRKVKDNKAQKDRIAKGKKKGKDLSAGLEEGDATQEQINDVVAHVIDQEMARLWKFRKDPEALNGELGKKGEVERTTTERDATDEDNDARAQQGLQPVEKVTIPAWQVPVVVLKCVDGEVVVSYSEMNTMPDLFGNPEAIMKTPKKKVLALLQGVRQQLYIELSNIREELTGTSNNKLHNKVQVDDDFKGAQGPRSQAVNEKAYEIRTESQVNKATTREGDEYEQYFAALERNACHFAPQSWHQWRGYHTKGVDLAKQSNKYRKLADAAEQQGGLDKIVQQYRVAQKDFANQAMIQNSFGEHYLQDSFAAGHLIDKTKIMQWFALWLEANGQGLGSGATAVGQWAMIVHAAGQQLKSNPQMLHDKMVRGEIKGGGDAAAEIGAKSTPEIEMLIRWRALAKGQRKFRSLSVKDVMTQFGYKKADAEQLLAAAVSKKFASKDFFGGKYTLSDSQLESVAPLLEDQSHAYVANKGTKRGQLSKGETAEAVDEFNVVAYNLLLSNAYLGSSTKFFHDMFCQQGLEVQTEDGTDLGRIYGDSNMMNAGGQFGLLWSAETSRMSRSSIFSIIAGEEDDEKYATADIEKRFPKKAKLPGGAMLPLEDFNTALKAEGDRKMFKEAKTVGALLVYKTMGGISDKGALDVDQLVTGLKKAIGPLDNNKSF